MIRPAPTGALCAVLLAAVPLGGQCETPHRVGALDRTLYESSGLTASRLRPGVFWTVVDSDGDSAVFAFSRHGLTQRVRVAGASNRDWEDVASGPCPGGSGSCLWIADTGDNLEVHADARLYVVPEPGPGDSVTAPARLFRARFPIGSRDAEALFVTPDGQPFIISKGRNRWPVRLYLFPLTDGVGELVPLQIFAEQVDLAHSVTGAAITRDGRVVAVRSYGEFVLFRVHGAGRSLTLEEIPRTRTAFVQKQGESVAFYGSRLYFTSEVDPGERSPLERTRCDAWPARTSRATR